MKNKQTNTKKQEKSSLNLMTHTQRLIKRYDIMKYDKTQLTVHT